MNAQELKIKVPVTFEQPLDPSIRETLDIITICSSSLAALPAEEFYHGDSEETPRSKCEEALFDCISYAARRLAAACAIVHIAEQAEQEVELNPT